MIEQFYLKNLSAVFDKLILICLNHFDSKKTAPERMKTQIGEK